MWRAETAHLQRGHPTEKSNLVQKNNKDGAELLVGNKIVAESRPRVKVSPEVRDICNK